MTRQTLHSRHDARRASQHCDDTAVRNRIHSNAGFESLHKVAVPLVEYTNILFERPDLHVTETFRVMGVVVAELQRQRRHWRLAALPEIPFANLAHSKAHQDIAMEELMVRQIVVLAVSVESRQAWSSVGSCPCTLRNNQRAKPFFFSASRASSSFLIAVDRHTIANDHVNSGRKRVCPFSLHTTYPRI